MQLSNRAINGVLVSVRNGRIDRIRKNPVSSDHSRKPANAFKLDDLSRIYWFIYRLEKEDGFPCSHRQPRQRLVKEGSTVASCRRINAMVMDSNKNRVCSYIRFTQYWTFYFLGLRTSRLESDACDSCSRINIAFVFPRRSLLGSSSKPWHKSEVTQVVCPEVAPAHLMCSQAKPSLWSHMV